MMIIFSAYESQSHFVDNVDKVIFFNHIKILHINLCIYVGWSSVENES